MLQYAKYHLRLMYMKRRSNVWEACKPPIGCGPRASEHMLQSMLVASDSNRKQLLTLTSANNIYI